MSEEERRRDQEEAFAVGRILGFIKRKDPELFNQIISIAESEGKKVSDIIVDALTMYVEFASYGQILPRQLFYSIKLIERLSNWALLMIANWMKLLTAQAIEMYRPTVEEEKEKPSTIPPELRAKMAEVYAELMRQLMTTLFSTFARIAQPQLQQQLPQPQAPQLPSAVKIVKSKKKEEEQKTVQHT